MEHPLTEVNLAAAPGFLSGGGEMGQRIRTYDWSSTELGAVASWPQSLRSALSICLHSNFPIAIYWGKDLTLLYNDAWSPIPGNKHPWALGKTAKEVWPEIWSFIEPQFQKAFNGHAGGAKDTLLPMQRHGYLEECYFDFTFTPVYGEGGNVEGVFNAVIETTKTILNERQLETLRDLGNLDRTTKTVDEVLTAAAKSLSKNNKDFPFATIYKIAEEENEAVALSCTGLSAGQTIFPSSIDLTGPGKESAGFCKAFASGQLVVSENAGKKGNLPKGGWDKEATHFVYIPVANQTNKAPVAMIAAALNPYRKFDDLYRQFVQLVSDQVSTEVTNVLAYEEERRRAEALAAIDKAKTAFFTNISHEFRTPLTLMLGSLETVLNRPGKPYDDNTENLVTAHRNAVRLLRLVNNLLDFNRLEAGRVKAKFQLTDIASLTQSLTSAFRSAIETAGLQFRVLCDGTSGPVYVDKEMWEKIVFNLLSNAFKYTLKGSITLSLAEVENKIILKVTDTGTGIAEAELPRIFERFHRIENSAGRSFEGTGIGLSLVKELVRLHGGQISVHSNEGKGTAFTVAIPTGKNHLPIDQVADNESVFGSTLAETFLAETNMIASAANQQNGKHLKEDAATVLVVDDNADMRNHIASLLEGRYNVIAAGNGAEALQKIKSQPVDLVVSDIMMPVMDGIDLLRTVKGEAETAMLPVILVSARAGEEEKLEGFDIGADDYLVKPFSSKELLARVRSQISLARKRNKALQSVYDLFEEVPFAVTVLKGKSLVIESINQYNLQIWNQTKDEVIGRPLFEVRPDIRAEAEAIHARVYETGQRFMANEIPITITTHGKQELRYFNSVIDPILNEDGEITGQLSTTLEVTSQVLARKRLEESESRFRSIADDAPVFIFMGNADAQLEYVNKTWARFTGLPGKEAIGQGWSLITHPDDLQLSFDTYNEAFKNRSSYQYEMRQKSVDGEYHWILWKGVPRYLPNGDFLGILGIGVDITNRKKAEAELQQLKEQLDVTFQNIPSAIYMLDEGGNIVFHNARGGFLIGETGSRGTAKSLEKFREKLSENFDLFDEKDSPLSFERRPVTVTLRTGKPSEITMKAVPKNGGPMLWLLLKTNPVFGSQGKLSYVLVVATDITKQKEGESELRTLKEQLEATIENVPAAVYLHDSKAAILYVNKPGLDTMKKILGNDFDVADDLSAMMKKASGKVEYCDENGLPVATEKYPTFLALNTGKESELLLKRTHRNTGEVNWFLNKATPLLDEDGKVKFVLSTATDFTKQLEAQERIQESNERLQAALNASKTGTFRWNIQTNELSWDENLDSLFGLPHGQTVQNLEKFIERVYPDDRQAIIDACLRCAAEGADFDLEFRVVLPDGGIRWLDDKGKTYRDENGKPFYMTGACVDITEHKLATGKIKQSEMRFEAAVNAVQGILWTNNARGEMEGEQAGWSALTGQRYDEYAGYGWAKAVHPDDAQPSVDAWNEAVHERKMFVFEHRVRRKDGSWGRYSVRAIPILNEDGSIREWVGVHTDVTEKSKAEQALQESESRFRLLAEKLPQLVWMQTADGKPEYLSSNWKEYSGMEEPDGGWKWMVHPGDWENVMSSWAKHFAARQGFKYEVRLRNKKGEYRWFYSIAEPIKNEGGEIVKWIGALTDIHEQKTLSEKLEKLVAERTRELQRSNEDLQQFAHVASHDLKEPVRKVRTFASRLGHDFGALLPETAKTYLDKIEKASERMYAMIDGVLHYSSFGIKEQKAEAVDLNEIFRQITADLEVVIAHEGATIHYQSLPSLNGSPVLLYQLFYNLVNNSLKFTKPGVPPVIQIEATTLRPADTNDNPVRIQITIKDNGIGFSQADAGKIFQTFTRLNSKDKYEGTGLGLSLCQKIVERHGGAIKAEGEPENGAAFTIVLPVLQQQDI